MRGKKYLILTYLLTALIVFYFSTSSEKQVISNYNVAFGFEDFIQILLKNSIASIWLLLAYIFGESIIYIFFIINGVILGLLLSSFSSITYLSDTIMNMRNQNQDKKKVTKRFIVSFLLLALAAGVETFITPFMINFIS